MIKQIAWNTFKNTGNIDTFLELLQFENMEKNILNKNLENTKVNEYGEFENKGNNIIRK